MSTQTQNGKSQAAKTQAGTAFDEALARHNARNPQSQLRDITSALEAAGAERLRSLMMKREPSFRDHLSHTLSLSDPRLRFIGASICAGMWIVHNVHGTEWEDMGSALETGSFPPVDRETKRLIVKRVCRAMRLLDRLIKVGCVKRGEGASARGTGGRG